MHESVSSVDSMSEHPGTSTAGATEQRPRTGASWMSSNNRGSMYAAVHVALSGGIVWLMTGAPDSMAKNWLILAWILLTSALTACALAPQPIHRGINYSLAGLCLVVTIAGSLTASDAVLAPPFIGLAIGFAGLSSSAGKRWWPEPAKPRGSPSELAQPVPGPDSPSKGRD